MSGTNVQTTENIIWGCAVGGLLIVFGVLFYFGLKWQGKRDRRGPETGETFGVLWTKQFNRYYRLFKCNHIAVFEVTHQQQQGTYTYYQQPIAPTQGVPARYS